MAYGIIESLDLEYSSAQYARATDSTSLSITGAITVESWIKIESFISATGIMPIISKTNISISNGGYQFSLEERSAGVWRLGLQISSGGGNITQSFGNTDFALPSLLGQWIHVAAVWNGSGASIPILYINGVDDGSAESTANATGLSDTNTDTSVGFQDGTARYFDGRVSLARIWSVVRTQNEISNNRCNVYNSATTNLVAEWSLNNVYTDASGNGNTLTPTGSPVFSGDIPALCPIILHHTHSADLNGTTQYLTRADDALLEGGSAFTVEGWIKPDAYGSKLVSKREPSPQRSYSIGIGGTNSSDSFLFGQLSSSGTGNAYDLSKLMPITLGTWYHFAFTFSGSGLSNEIKYYLDGVQQGTTDVPGFASVFNNTASFAIGIENPSTPVDFYNGRVSLVRFWNVVRTQAEIQANMCTIVAPTPNLGGQWVLNDSVLDNSGNRNHLVNNGGVVFTAEVPSLCCVLSEENTMVGQSSTSITKRIEMVGY